MTNQDPVLQARLTITSDEYAGDEAVAFTLYRETPCGDGAPLPTLPTRPVIRLC